MRKKWLFCSVVFTLMTGVIQAETLVDFGKLSSTQLILPLAAKGQECVNETDKNTPILILEWNFSEAQWFSASLKKAVMLPKFVKGRFRVQLHRKADDGVKCFSLFFADRDHETFQLTRNLPPVGAATQQQIVFDLNCSDFKGNVWGGKNKNRTIDFPLRFTGISCSFSRKDGVGSLGVGAVEFECDKNDSGN